MVDATVATVTIRPQEAEHFARLAKDWWDPNGSSAMLHRVNPVRLQFIREAIDLHWGGDIAEGHPLAGRRALDVGCGAGLLAEPLARLGAEVTGIDAAAENIAVARRHAEGAGLLAADQPATGSVRYRHGELSALDAPPFDLVTCMEVLEHVADKPAFVAQLAHHLAPDGLLVISTPNRTVTSRMLLVGGAEMVGMVPRGTHRWSDFATPEELHGLLTGAGLVMGNPRGIAWSPMQRLHLSSDLSLNYIVTAQRPVR